MSEIEIRFRMNMKTGKKDIVIDFHGDEDLMRHEHEKKHREVVERLVGEGVIMADEVGEVIDHVDGVTIEEAEHMIATRLWQNTAKVHFDTTARPDGSRLIYGGHVISMARTLSFNGLANAQMIVGLNGGAHANPCLSGMTIRAWSEVLDKAETTAPGVGAIRLRLVATKGGDTFTLRGEDGKYLPHVLRDLDYWALMPL